MTPMFDVGEIVQLRPEKVADQSPQYQGLGRGEIVSIDSSRGAYPTPSAWESQFVYLVDFGGDIPLWCDQSWLHVVDNQQPLPYEADEPEIVFRS